VSLPAPSRGPLQDGTYRAPGAWRVPRALLLAVAVLCMVTLLGVAGQAFSALLLGLVATLALVARVLLGRPRLEVSAAGVRVVGVLRTRLVPWPSVRGAGARAARGPLGRVEQVLVVGRGAGADLPVPVVRGPVDVATGRAGEVVTIATALVQRARLENGELPTALVVPAAARVDETLRQPWRPQSATVAALLAHLSGLVDGVPRPLGRDATGREVLSVLPGERVASPLPSACWSDGALVSAASYLRRVHDATTTWPVPVGARWGRPPREPAEVVLHGDVSAYTLRWSGPRVVGLVDWDQVRPGPRVVDVAVAAYRLVPLTSPGTPDAPGELAEQVRRLPLFVAAYGLADPSRLVEEVVAHVRFLRGLGRDVGVYDGDLAWLASQGGELQRALG